MDETFGTQGAEDAINYRIFLPSTRDLENVAVDMLAHVHNRCRFEERTYIWQRSSFNLQAVDLGSKKQRLEGRTEFGDCIDDEWFIVWLLRDISLAWPDAVIRVEDQDGQFLLIEAAEVLPRWVSPANAENRVWFHRGKLHLLPLRYRTDPPLNLSDDLDRDGYIDEAGAVGFVSREGENTLAPLEVQDAVSKRISKYPGSIPTEHLHRTFAYLPVEIQMALSLQPQLVSCAVSAFYQRDPLQLKACHAMSKFPPMGSGRTLVQMTRPLYGQLICQRFYAPRPFERAKWFEGAQEGTAEHRWRDVGMKLTCGFEMLYQETKSRLKRTTLARDDATADLKRAPQFDRFVQLLERSGYFQGEAQGSKLHKELLESARHQWSAHAAASDDCFAKQVEDAIQSVKSLVPTPLAGQVEDSDSWLDLDPQGLEELLKQRTGHEQLTEEDKADAVAEALVDPLTSFAQKVEGFVEGEGSLEGAMFEDELSDDEIDSSDEEAGEPMMSTEDKRAAQDRLVEPLAEGDWGRKTEETSATKPPRFEGEKYDGASDTSSEGDEEYQPAPLQAEVDDDPEVDLSDEMGDFLTFAREALGLSESQFGDILTQRRARGAFVPTDAQMQRKPPSLQERAEMAVDEDSQATGAGKSNRANTSAGVRRPANPNLDSFEALMEAMEAELKEGKSAASHRDADTIQEDWESDSDVDLHLDAELAEKLKRDADDVDMEDLPDYGLMKNFLESYKSQAGLAGPVSNLAGRLDPTIRLPQERGEDDR